MSDSKRHDRVQLRLCEPDICVSYTIARQCLSRALLRVMLTTVVLMFRLCRSESDLMLPRGLLACFMQKHDTRVASWSPLKPSKRTSLFGNTRDFPSENASQPAVFDPLLDALTTQVRAAVIVSTDSITSNMPKSLGVL